MQKVFPSIKAIRRKCILNKSDAVHAAKKSLKIIKQIRIPFQAGMKSFYFKVRPSQLRTIHLVFKCAVKKIIQI